MGAGGEYRATGRSEEGGAWVGEMGEQGPKVQNSCYKMNTSRGCMYSVVTIVNSSVLYI